jgi:hypothetical protein
MKIEIDGEFFYVPDNAVTSATESTLNISQSNNNQEIGERGERVSLYSLLLGSAKSTGTRGTTLLDKTLLTEKSKNNSPRKENKAQPVPLVPLLPENRYGFNTIPCTIKGNKAATDKWLDSEYIRLGFVTMRGVTPKSFWKDNEGGFEPI